MKTGLNHPAARTFLENKQSPLILKGIDCLITIFIHSLHLLSNATAPMLYTMKVPPRLRYLGAVYSSPMTPSHSNVHLGTISRVSSYPRHFLHVPRVLNPLSAQAETSSPAPLSPSSVLGPTSPLQLQTSPAFPFSSSYYPLRFALSKC